MERWSREAVGCEVAMEDHPLRGRGDQTGRVERRPQPGHLSRVVSIAAGRSFLRTARGKGWLVAHRRSLTYPGAGLSAMRTMMRARG